MPNHLSAAALRRYAEALAPAFAPGLAGGPCFEPDRSIMLRVTRDGMPTCEIAQSTLERPDIPAPVAGRLYTVGR